MRTLRLLTAVAVAVRASLEFSPQQATDDMGALPANAVFFTGVSAADPCLCDYCAHSTRVLPPCAHPQHAKMIAHSTASASAPSASVTTAGPARTARTR